MIKEIKTQDGYVFFVHDSFLKKCDNPKEYFAYDLINDYSLIKYLATPNEMFADKFERLLNDN